MMATMADSSKHKLAAPRESLSGLPRADAGRLEALALQDRMETKFLLSEADLRPCLDALGGQCGLATAGTDILSSYQNLYFETPGRTFYHQHRRGQRPRYKVRVRHYLDRQVSVLDVKCKSNREVSHKISRARAFGDETLGDEDRAFLAAHTPVEPGQLGPQVMTNFRRITLVGLSFPERITIDLDLSFEGHGWTCALPGLVILEVKQARLAPRSPAMLALRARGMRPARISKYCTAQIHLDSTLRQNRFRELKRAIGRLSHA